MVERAALMLGLLRAVVVRVHHGVPAAFFSIPGFAAHFLSDGASYAGCIFPLHRAPSQLDLQIILPFLM